MPSIEVTFNGQRDRTIDLQKEVCVIGRQEGCEIHIDNLGISRNHARLLRDGSTYCVEDMNSSNGTYVNGQQVKRYSLNEGDEIAIGKFILVYHATVNQSGGANPFTPEAAAAAAAQMPGDALNTMAMDGEMIKKRMEEMVQAKKEADENQISPIKRKPKETASLARAELHAREAERHMTERRVKTIKILVVLGMLAALGAIIVYVTTL